MKKRKPLEVDCAPVGYHAVDIAGGCVGCAFESGTSCGFDHPCLPIERKDRHTVIFISNASDHGRETDRKDG